MTPFPGYNSESYPFILIRGRQLNLLDTKTNEIKPYSQLNMSLEHDEYANWKSIFGIVKENKKRFVGLGGKMAEG